MKKDEMIVLGLAGVAVFLILKAGGIGLPSLSSLTKPKPPARTGAQWEAAGIMIDNNSKWSSTGRPWFDPWTASVDGGFIPQGL